MHSYSSVSISTRNLMCLVSPVTKIWLGAVYRRRLGFDTVYLHAHFDGFNFSRSTSVASKFKMGRVTLTTLHLRVICHPYAGTWHNLHACNIWPLYSLVQPFRRYSCCLPKFKCLTWPDHAPFRDSLSIHGLALATMNLSAKFEVSIFTHYEDTKGATKYRKMGWFGVVRFTQGHSK